MMIFTSSAASSLVLKESSAETRLTSIVVRPATKKHSATDSSVHSNHFLELSLCLETMRQKPCLSPAAPPPPPPPLLSPPLSYV